MAHDMSPELEAAIAAAQAAGRLQRRRLRRHLDVDIKDDGTPVTRADRESERLIVRMLEPVLPGSGFLCEELGSTTGSSDIRWIVDPLDGTKKFVRGLPFFGPCIALERGGVLTVGVIHIPALRETYWAERGAGAHLNGRRIQVSGEGQLDRAYVVRGNDAAFYDRGWGGTLERVVRSVYHNPGFLDLYTYGALASGRVDAVVMVGEEPWDLAAARVIVEEAGGRMTDFLGAPTIYGGTALTTNGHLHDALLALLTMPEAGAVTSS
ncbi:MAG: hypothetical protein GEU73_12770 [Chloroflexi bacterium]|nr:hypothetical protein [Chloroflexota bacterium]